MDGFYEYDISETAHTVLFDKSNQGWFLRCECGKRFGYFPTYEEAYEAAVKHERGDDGDA